MGEPAKLTDIQINDLMEIANVGVGRASARLSDLIRRRCLIDLPQVSYMDGAELEAAFNTEDSFAVSLHVKVLGDVPAFMFILTRRTHAHVLVNHITKGSGAATGKDLNFTAMFALRQIGEAMTKAFSGSLNDLLNTKTKQSMPEIVNDHWSDAVHAVIEKMGSPEEKKLVVSLTFYDPERTFEGKYVYVLSEQARRVVLDKVQGLLEDLPPAKGKWEIV